jgi:subfamily B ATP-binding cassette protein HlyB/CyaB
MLLRFHGVGADPDQVRHRFGGSAIDIPEMLRCARELGLKAQTRTSSWKRLASTPLPVIAALRDGGFLLLGKTGDDKALVQSPLSSQPSLMTRAEFEGVWNGQLVLMTRRAGLTDLSRRFDISWFLGAIHKYRGLLAEVLVASFFLQLFALISPLFFQVVIDKVLVHRTLGTLDVLTIGLVAVAIFETVLGVLRTYLFAHTTNRIDVELGARLFRHLVALPIAYFQARRVGDSVARVRELENIRNFLTSSALTLVIDLFFTIVFLLVMFIYSPLLTFVVLGAFPFYIAISAGATPLFRRRLDEKFARGAENQAFLVESVTGAAGCAQRPAPPVQFPETRRGLEQQLDVQVPGWRQLYNYPNWRAWLDAPDDLSGQSRRELINRAAEAGDVHRVAAFFQHPPAAQHAQARSYRSPPAATGGKVLYTRPQIAKLYEQRRLGTISEGQWGPIEANIVAAGREGRIAGALDRDGNKLTEMR